jgi:hypothetical protein
MEGAGGAAVWKSRRDSQVERGTKEKIRTVRHGFVIENKGDQIAIIPGLLE